jgi:hypothetical protein
VEVRKERAFTVDGSLGESVEQAITRAKNLGSKYGSLAWGLVIRRSGSATFIEYHAYLVAPNNFFITANRRV